MQMRFEALGPLRVLDDGQDVTPAGRLQRIMLGWLLLRANQTVRDDLLIEALWPGDVAARTPARLQVLTHRLRAMLDDPERLSRETFGYRLRVERDEYDVAGFDDLAARVLALEGDPAAVSRHAREALDLWRGAPMADVEELALAPELQRWSARRLMVLESLAEADLALGNHGAVLPELELAAREHPLDEGLQLLLMRALHLAGRPADALGAYAAAHASLGEELGLEPGAALRDLQARILAGDEAEPPAKPRPTPAQLPAGASRLFGRDQDLARLDKQWGETDEAGVWVITGTAGVGKTAFAVQWARQHRADYPDGQLFYDLRGFSADNPAAPADVLGVFLRGLGFDTAGLSEDEDERAALFRSMVDGRRLLIVLDNARSADQVRPLLPATQGCCVLVTSRESLTGLAVREGAQTVDLPPLNDQDSLDLLVELTDDRVREESAPAAELVRLCARLPLALRIAAEQVRAHPDRKVAALVAELSGEHDRLDLLDAGDGPATDVRAVFSWSYESLPAEAARLFRHFGMLPGKDAGLHALAALSDRDANDVRRSLAVLLRAHLITESPARRYFQHDLLRAYAGEGARLLESDDARRAARSRLLGHYSRRAALADDLLRPAETFSKARIREPHPVVPEFAGRSEALAWMARELPNVLAAVDDVGPSDAHRVVELAQSFSDLLSSHGRIEEGDRLHRRARDIARDHGDPRSEALAESSLGVNRARSGDPGSAREHFLRSLAIHEHRTHDPVGRAALEGNLGALAYVRGDLGEAARLAESSRSAFEAAGERRRTALQATNLASILKAQGETVRPGELVAESVSIARADGLWAELSTGLNSLADLRYEAGDLDAATALAVEASKVASDHGFHEIEADAQATLGDIAHARGDFREAQEIFRTALRGAHMSGHVLTVAVCLRGFARAVSGEDPAGGLAYCREAVDYASTNGLTRVEVTVRLDLARHLDRRGDRAGALVEVDRAAALCEGSDDRLVSEVARIRAELAE
ncbi:hypothetical protein ASD66_18465 [Nocardioides sp. Root151]|nr:hypothetical protein ASD66_18465 [Nocardioides sp. Root151]